jgi:hypothetical protein
MPRKQEYYQPRLSREAAELMMDCFMPEHILCGGYRVLGDSLEKILKKVDPLFIGCMGMYGVSRYSGELDDQRDERFATRAFIYLSHTFLRIQLAADASKKSFLEYFGDPQDPFVKEVRALFLAEQS